MDLRISNSACWPKMAGSLRYPKPTAMAYKIRNVSAGNPSSQGRWLHWLRWRLQTSPITVWGCVPSGCLARLRPWWASVLGAEPWILVKLPVCFLLVSSSDWSNFHTRWTFQIRYREGSQPSIASNISSVPSPNSLCHVNDCVCVHACVHMSYRVLVKRSSG